MKTSLIFRIICWSVIALLLCGVLLWGIEKNGFSFSLSPLFFFRQSSADFGQLTGEAGAYSADNAYAVAPGSIKNIRISWVGGAVSIAPYDGDAIAFSESALNTIAESHALRYALSNETLTIHYSAHSAGWNRPWWNFPKKLTVQIPQSLATNMMR